MIRAALTSRAVDKYQKQVTRTPHFLSLFSKREKHLYEQIPPRIDYMPDPRFDLADAEQELFGEDRMINLPRWRYYPLSEDDISGGRSDNNVLSQDDESKLFLRYNYARYQMSKLLDAQSKRATMSRARQMIFWFERVLKAREDLSEANMALVFAMAKRSQVTNVEFSELIGEGNMALLKSIDKFDVSRGYKFSTYACRVILKRFKRLARKSQRHRKFFPTEFDPHFQRSDYAEHQHQNQHENYLEGLQDILSSNQAGLSYIEQKIIIERFGIHSRGPKRPLTQVGEICGLSNERVRQIQNVALNKLRTALKHHLLAC